jgi:hypothetical protein
MSLQMLEQVQAAKDETTNEIYLPMDRSDIADDVGASPAALSRAFRTPRAASCNAETAACENRGSRRLRQGSRQYIS